MTFDNQEGKNNVKVELENIELSLQRLEKRVTKVEEKQDKLEQQQIVVQQRVTTLENKKCSCIPHAPSYYFSTCETDMLYNIECYDPDTRQWLLDDFDTWFNNPKESRAYVLLGDAAVGKSVMAAVVAQRAKNNGNLAAAYFCRHYDDTRHDPRYLLGSVAYQMCKCNSDYSKKVGEETGIQNMLADSLLGVHELFTKLLEEPLAECHFSQRKLVVIDALDESEHSSRGKFLDLIKDRFPRLPDWLLFFITSRPEDSVENRLVRYNPCVKICAGNSESVECYQQHEQAIQQFLQKRVNFSSRPYSAKEIAKKCDGMFLYAVYLVPILNDPLRRDEYDKLPENIHDFFRENSERVCQTLGKDFYKILFSCVLVAPSPLPISFISFLLRREACALDEQDVIDAVSLFVRNTTNETFTFLHNLIPTWLTNEKKASRRLCINRKEANTLFEDIILYFLKDFVQDEGDKLSFVRPDSVDYILHFGFRFICNSCSKRKNEEVVFNCLTNFKFLQQRIRSSKVGIYFLIEDLKFSNNNHFLDKNKKTILCNLRSVLEHDKHVIAGCPELLYSCLSNASKFTQETILGSQVLSSLLTEPSMGFTDLPLNSILCDCGAFSHDKKLFAGGLGRKFFMFDVRTLQKIVGPIEVTDSDKLSHLEFSSDDRFVFFGRLDKWFSVQEKRVAEIAQFTGNVNYYKWGSFVHDGSYIAVIKNEIDGADLNSVGHIFLKWWLHEICLEQGEELKYIPCEDEIFCRIYDYYVRPFSVLRAFKKFQIKDNVVDELEGLTSQLYTCLNLPCKFCQSYGEVRTARAQITHLFADIFRYQIWNVKTGRPVIEEMFCRQLEPFLYLWHIFPSIKTSNDLSFCFDVTDATVVNFAALITLKNSVPENFKSLLHVTIFSELGIDDDPDFASSQDGKFAATKDKHGISLRRPGSTLVPIEFGDLKYYCFTNDSNYFLYVTHMPDPELCAFSLQTGETLQSISGLCPVVYASKEHKCFGYIFSRASERIMISLGDFSGDFFLGCINCDTSKFSHPIEATFTSTDTITFFSCGMPKSWKIGVDVLALDAVVLERHCLHVKKCAFSYDGKLIAIYHSNVIVLFNCEGKLLSEVFTVREQNEHTLCCLTFSPDASFLLFSINESSINQLSYIWDVQNEDLSTLTNLSLEMPFDCACFAQDNSKIFFCTAYAILIYPYPNKCHKRKISIPSKACLKCTHCAVSPDNKLLACCIGNEILVHPLDGRNDFWEVPQNYSGLIKSCKFLKESRYLISYGIDNVVLLFDLSEWKSVAYARLQESVSTIALSPDEDKVVSLGSSGEVRLINLHGLRCGLPSHFQLPSAFRLPDNREPQVGLRRESPPSGSDSEMEDMVDEDVELTPYSSDSS